MDIQKVLLKLNIRFFIKDCELLEKYNKLRDKVSSSIKKAFDCEQIYNKKYLKTEKTFYEGKISTNFHDGRITNERSHCIFVSVICIDSAFKIHKSYYTQAFLEECKYMVKEKKD